MAQTVFGQTDALALSIAAWLNTFPLSMPIKAQRRFVLIDTASALPDVNSPVQVDIFPDIEICDRQGVSPAFASHYAVHLFIQQRLTGAANEDAQCALLTQLRSQIIEGMKPWPGFQIPNAVNVPSQGLYLVQVKNADQKGLYDLARLLGQHVYASDTILVFRAAV